MKILVLYHTAWMQMMIHLWERINGVKIISLPLPTADWNNQPELKTKVAKLIPQLADIEKPTFILDVNGAGILPLNPEKTIWTPQACNCKWVEWRWDDYFADLSECSNCEESYYDALTAENIVHFFWDKELAEEYSIWLKRPVKYLPTATHPEAFSPDSAKMAQKKFSQNDISFLGTFYQSFKIPEEWQKEIEHVSAQRLQNATKNYFKIIEESSDVIPHFAGAFKTAKEKKAGCFSKEMQKLRNYSNALVGKCRRNDMLGKIAKKINSTFFAGTNWPEGINASKEKIYNPSDLSALFQSSLFNLDLGNGQSFSGLNMRSYEIMACGGILVKNQLPDFDPCGELQGKIYLKFSSSEEVQEILKSYRSKPEKLDEIRNNARQFILEKHTWLNRFSELISGLS